METSEKKLDFERPPVEEVMLSILFQPLDQFLAPHLGEIWREFKKYGFVYTSAHGSVAPAIESFSNQIPQPQVHISNIPDFQRILFTHESGGQILQVQRDRFTFNWRKIEGGQKYPGFLDILTSFEDFYTCFRESLKNEGIGEIIPLQYELSYINQLLHGESWNTLGEIGQIYNIFVDSQQLRSSWAGAEFMILQASFPVVDLNGRLHLAISNRVKLPDQRQTLQTDFTMRGFSESAESEMIMWFKSAHEQIFEKFVSMFTEDIQTRVWGRKS